MIFLQVSLFPCFTSLRLGHVDLCDMPVLRHTIANGLLIYLGITISLDFYKPTGDSGFFLVMALNILRKWTANSLLKPVD